MPFRRFVSFCGYPTTVIPDCGTKLVATSKELEDTIKNLNQEQLTEYGAEMGMEWHVAFYHTSWILVKWMLRIID